MTKTIIWAVALVVSAIILASGGLNAERVMIPPEEPAPPPADSDSVPVAITNFPTVDIRGFPHVVTVDGAVDVNNFPATQNVAGTVNVGNLPLDEDGNLRVSSAAEPRIPIRASDFPLTIDSSGSYYLVEDVSTYDAGITIRAENVTIDLMGFTIDSGYSTAIQSFSRSVTIMNGALTRELNPITSMGDPDRLAVVRLGAHSTVRNVTILEAYFITGISVGPYSLVHGCRARTNHSVAISAGTGSVVEDSVVDTVGDASHGILVVGSIVRGCTIDSGGIGIVASDGSHVSNSIITANWGGGVYGGSVLADSIVSSVYAGISVGSNSVVRGCRVEGGVDYGIYVSGDGNIVLGNEVSGPGGVSPDIQVQGNRNRIEGNNLRSSGLEVDGIDNVIVKNTSYGSGSFDIAAGNTFGPIVNVAGGGDLASYTDSDHPQANFEY